MALETSEWLVWAGIEQPQTSSSTVQGDVNRLKEGFADYDAFQTATDADTSFSEWETTLVDDGGFTAQAAADLRAKAEQNFADWASFEDFVVNQTDTYAEFQQGFSSTSGLTGKLTTEAGEPTAGIRVHDSAGTSYAGVSVPAGTTEVFGNRIEFSQQSPSTDPDPAVYSNLQVDDPDNVVQVSVELTISADVQNPNNQRIDVTVPLLLDGEVVQRKTVGILALSTETVEFTLRRTEYVCYDVSIGDLSPETICWAPAGITGGL